MYYIYCIENKLNNKIYIGKSKNPKQRWLNHKSIAKGGYNNPNFSYIHKSLAKHINNIDEIFTFHIVESYETEQESYNAEKEWIIYLKSQNVILYNLSEGGEGFKSGKEHPNWSKPLAVDIKMKISKKNKGKIRTPEQIENLSKSKIGKHIGEFGNNSKLKENQVLIIKNLILQGISEQEIAIHFNVSKHTIHDIKYQRTWKHLK